MSVRHRVSVIIISENKILGFKAEDPSSGKRYVFLPGGLIEENETVEAAAIRETLEETGYEIQIPKQETISRRYVFHWDGKDYDCLTEYLEGHLVTDQANVVQDADYHRGVVWIPVAEIQSTFSYHKDVSEPVQQIASRWTL